MQKIYCVLHLKKLLGNQIEEFRFSDRFKYDIYPFSSRTGSSFEDFNYTYIIVIILIN